MNKQRLTKITPKERQAAKSGGALDFSLPEAKLRQRLQDQPQTFDADQVLGELARLVAWERMLGPASSMKRSEICRQARDTVAVIDDLIARFQHLHPVLTSHADEVIYRSFGEFGFNLTERIAPDLYRFRGALNQAIAAMESEPAQPGPKGKWTALQNAAAEILRSYSEPKLNKAEAKEMARELLDLCGVQRTIRA